MGNKKNEREKLMAVLVSIGFDRYVVREMAIEQLKRIVKSHTR